MRPSLSPPESDPHIVLFLRELKTGGAPPIPQPSRAIRIRQTGVDPEQRFLLTTPVLKCHQFPTERRLPAGTIPRIHERSPQLGRLQRWRNRAWCVGKALQRMLVGLIEVDDTRHAVYFGELLVGYLDTRTPGSLQPAVPRPPAAPGPAPEVAV
jgi:hypothetical protein